MLLLFLTLVWLKSTTRCCVSFFLVAQISRRTTCWIYKHIEQRCQQLNENFLRATSRTLTRSVVRVLVERVSWKSEALAVDRSEDPIVVVLDAEVSDDRVAAAAAGDADERDVRRGGV